MKKTLIKILILVMCLCSLLAFAGCGHTHDYTIVKYNENTHWIECECGEKTAVGFHTGGTATCTEQAECSVCNQKYGKLEKTGFLDDSKLKFLKFDSKLDDESDEDFKFRNTKKITTLDDGTVVEESDDEFKFRRNQRVSKINTINEALTKDWVDNIITTLQKVDGNLDPITSRYILQHLPQRVKDVINYKLSESNISAKKQDVISRLKADLSNIDEIMEALNQFDEYKDPFKSFVQSVRNVVD